jgi:hypothetical protein
MGIATVAPSMMMRFGSGPASPERQSIAAPLTTPSKQRGTSLPNRPLPWSPTRDKWTTPRVGVAPSVSEEGQSPDSGLDSFHYRNSQSYDQGYFNGTVPPQAAPSQGAAGFGGYWPYPPLSPLQLFTQPPSVHPSPMMQTEYGTPYWHAISTDPNGQRFVVHPVGGFCPCIHPFPFPQVQGGQAAAMTTECSNPNQNHEQAQQMMVIQEEKHPRRVNSLGQSQDEPPSMFGIQGTQYKPYNTGNVNSVPFVCPPSQYLAPLCPPMSFPNAKPWPLQQQQQNQQQQQQQQQEATKYQHAFFPEQNQWKGMQPQRGNLGEEGMQNNVHYPVQTNFDCNPGPIQIPAVSDVETQKVGECGVVLTMSFCRLSVDE